MIFFLTRRGEEWTYGNALLDNCKTQLSTRNDLHNKFRHVHIQILLPKNRSPKLKRLTPWSECAGLETKAGQQEANCF